MYHGMTFSVENVPLLTFSCDTDGDLILMNGLPHMERMVTLLGRLVHKWNFLYNTYGDLIRERGMGLTFFYGTCSDLIRRMVPISHGVTFSIWKD